MKKSLFLFTLLVLLIFGFVVSCPNGPEPPRSVVVSFSSAVDRDSNDEPWDGYKLSLDSYYVRYKIYPADSWSTELRGTVRDWRTVTDSSNDVIKVADDGVTVESLKIGDLTPTDWTLEIQFVDRESNSVVFYGKKDRFSVDQSDSVIQLGSFVKPYVDLNKTGNIELFVEIDDLSEVKIDQGLFSFLYRYNNSNEAIWNGGSFESVVILEYDGSSEEFEDIIVDGEKKGYVHYSPSDNSFNIRLENVPYGMYFYQLVNTYTFGGNFYYACSDGTYQGEDQEMIYSENEGLIPLLLFSGSDSPKGLKKFELKCTENGIGPKLEDGESKVFRTKSVLVKNVNGASNLAELEADVNQITFVPLFQDKSGVDYEWRYDNPVTGETETSDSKFMFTLDFSTNSADYYRYNGSKVILTTTDKTNGQKIVNEIPIAVGYSLNIISQIKVDDKDYSVIESVSVGTKELKTGLTSSNGTTNNYKFNFTEGDKVRVYLNAKDDQRKTSDGRKLVYIDTVPGWHKNINKDGISLLTGTGGRGPKIEVSEDGTYFDFDMVTKSSLDLTLTPEPNTITVFIDEGKLIDGSNSREDIKFKYINNGVELKWNGSRTLDKDEIFNNSPTGYVFGGWTPNNANILIGLDYDKLTNDKVDFKEALENASEDLVFRLSAVWIPNTYTIDFDGNDNTSGATASVIATYDTDVVLPENGFERIGYTFTGWKDENNNDITGLTYNDETKEYLAKNLTSKKDGPVTLYAQWEANTYTIAFDGNGATSGVMSPITATYGNYIALTSNRFTRTGYEFAGWNTEKDGSGISYKDKVSVPNLTTENGDIVTLYAQWEAHNCNVKFDSNDGSSADGIVVVYDSSYGELPIPTRTGYRFDGWFDSAVGGKLITAESKVETDDEHVLYAHWTANTYNVVFDSNGGSPIDDITVTYDSTYGSLSEPIKTGYTFMGWYLNSEYTGAKVTEDTTVNTADNHTLYAQWEANKYELRYSGYNNNNETREVTYDTQYGDAAEVKDGIREGYEFKGWKLNPSGTIIKSNDIVEITSDTDVHPVWEKIKYTLTVVAGDDKVEVSKSPIKDYYYIGDEVEITAEPKEGYEFDTWEIDNAEAKIENYNKATTYLTMPAGNVTVTAKVKPISDISVFLLDADDNYFGQISNIEFGSTYYDYLTDPEKEGYTFADWYYKDSGDKEITIEKDTPVILGVKMIYARWEPNTYTIEFNANNGTGSMNDQSMTYDENKALNENKYTRNGYLFAGWSTTENGDVVYSDNDNVINLSSVNGDIYTLYAVWVAKEYTVELNYGDDVISIPATHDSTYGDLPTPTKTGYKFEGWYLGDVNDENNRVYSYTRVTSSDPLVAKWTAETYEVKFDTNGGSSINGITVTYDSTYGDLPTPTKTGYTFAHWSLDEYEDIDVSSTTVKIAESHTLYAVWTPNTYTIKFNANDGTGSMANQSMTYDENKALDKNKYTRNGYLFMGWKLDNDGPLYRDEALVSNLTDVKDGTVILYAQWVADCYTVDLKDDDDKIIDSITVTHDSTYGNLPTPKKTGYEFDGWYLDDKKVEADTRVESDRSLTARWTAKKYSIDGSDKIYEYGVRVTVTEDINIPEGYKYKDIDVSGIDRSEVTVIDPSSITDTITFEIESMPANGVVITVITEPISYSITLNSNYDGRSISIPASYDEVIDLSEYNYFTRSGYGLIGWSENHGSDDGSLSVSNLTTKDGDTVTLYAVWKADEYSIEFKDEDGNVINTKSVTYGKGYGELPKPERTGYEFDGWYLGDKKVDANTPVESTDPLVAKWTAETYTVTFDSYGNRYNGSNNSFYSTVNGFNETLIGSEIVSTNNTEKGHVLNANGLDTTEVTYGDKFKLPTLTSKGWIFNGWFINGEKVEEGSVVEFTENVNIKASWEPEPYKISLNSSTKKEIENGKIVSITASSSSPSTKLFASGDGNASSSGVSDFENDKYYYGDEITLKAKTRPGYKVTDWKDNNKVEKQAFYAPSNTKDDEWKIKMDLETNVVVGLIVDKSTVSVEFDTNKTNGPNEVLSKQEPAGLKEWFEANNLESETLTVTYDELYPELPTLTRTGWKFGGWVDADGKEVKSYVDKVSNPEDHKLKAIWTLPSNDPDCYYKIDIKSNDDNVSFNVSPDSGYLGQEIKITATPNPGYEFVKWIIDDGTDQGNDDLTNLGAPNNTVNPITINMPAGGEILKAVIEAKDIRVFLDEDSTPSIVKFGEKYGELPDLSGSKKGYTFTGWYYGDGDEKIEVDSILNDPDIDHVTLKPGWDPISYTLTYNYDGGDVSGTAYESYTIESELFTLVNPTKEGYEFLGWTGSNGTTAQKDVTIPKGSTEDREYIAHWTPINYRITYEANDGTLPTGIRESYTIEEEFSLADNLTRDGYEFTGWTGSNGTTAQKAVTIPKGSTGDRNYKANWEVKTYAITYDYNGGEDSGNPTSYTIEIENITLKNPTRTGYTFAGWTGTDLTVAKENVTISSGSFGNKEYKATWKVITYTITCDYNASGAGEVTTPSYPNTYNIETPTFTLGTTYLNPTREGHEFAGWIGTGLTRPTKNVTIPKGSTGDRTYTANWNAETYEIVFVIEGNYYYASAKYGDSYEAVFKGVENKLVRTGWNFSGWFTDKNGRGTKVVGTGMVTGSITLYAYFTFEPYNLRVVSGSHVTTVTGSKGGATYNESIMITADKFDDGYEFSNWEVTSGPSNLIKGSNKTKNRVTIIMPAENVTITAIAKPITYKISYEYGAEDIPANGNPYKYTIETPRFTLNNPTRDYYDFAGWTGTGLDGRVKNVTIENTIGNKEFTPNWNPKSYSIKLENCDSETSLVYTVESNTSSLPTPSRDGYDFIGWTGSNGRSPQKTVKITKGSTGDRTYTANWKPISYKITYNLDGGKVIVNGKVVDNLETYTIESANITLINPEKKGFQFTGWTGTGLDGATETVTIAKGSFGEREYTANWNRLTYSVRYVLNADDAYFEKGINPTEYNVQTPSFTLEMPTRKGYRFKGWLGPDLPVDMPMEIVTIPIGSIGDRVYTANWEINTYHVMYLLAGGKLANARYDYTVNDEFDVGIPTREGYVFKGWTSKSFAGSIENITVKKGSTGDIILTATWEKVEAATPTFILYDEPFPQIPQIPARPASDFALPTLYL